MSVELSLTGKSVLITGGSRGIGLATALACAEAGANVAFTYEKNELAAAEAVRLIEERGVQALSFRASNDDEPLLAAVIAEIAGTWGTVDVAVANAGIWEEASVDDMPLGDFERMMSINMTGTFILAKHVVPRMKEQKSGSIVIVSSTAGQRGEAHHSHYAASKGAQISFTKSLAPELAPYGIRVNCVAPGWVQTEMTRTTLEDPSTMPEIERAIPLKRVGRPEEIANAILFIASPLASFITGEVLNVNGGSVLCG